MQRFTISPRLHSRLGLIETTAPNEPSNSLDDGGKALADADAQADEGAAPAAPLQLAHGRQREPRSRGAVRMAGFRRPRGRRLARCRVVDRGIRSSGTASRRARADGTTPGGSRQFSLARSTRSPSTTHARSAGEVRAALEAAGTPIGAYDLMIGGQALRRRLTLVTTDVGEFARIAGLAWRDWASQR